MYHDGEDVTPCLACAYVLEADCGFTKKAAVLVSLAIDLASASAHALVVVENLAKHVVRLNDLVAYSLLLLPQLFVECFEIP